MILRQIRGSNRTHHPLSWVRKVNARLLQKFLIEKSKYIDIVQHAGSSESCFPFDWRKRSKPVFLRHGRLDQYQVWSLTNFFQFDLSQL